MDSYTVRKQTLKRRITIPVNGFDESELKDYLKKMDCCDDVYGITDVVDEETTKKCVFKAKGTKTDIETVKRTLERKNIEFDVVKC